MIKVNEIEVPREIEYISDWVDFSYPQGHIILDKSICGCGFTEYCLTNNIPIILCSPRKILLKNKQEQHVGDPIYYFENDKSIAFETPYDSDSTTVKAFGEIEDVDYINKLKNLLREWLTKTIYVEKRVPKILVTYDSLHHVLDALGEIANNFSVVVDEFQSIFMDSTFKSEVELDFVEDLKDISNVLYLSATPMLEKYLSQVSYFSSLPFYKLIWDSSRIDRIKINRRIVKSINSAISEYVNEFRNNIFPNRVLPDKTVIEAKELVIFCNSVKSICDIARKVNWLDSEVNVICSDTPENRKSLKKVGLNIGRIPTKEETPKMFTICTRTSYLGADFYNNNSFTIICSDSGIETMTVDISLDLPQIIGRQRKKDNLFKNEVLFLYKMQTRTKSSYRVTREEFENFVQKKVEETETLLDEYNKMSEEGKLSWGKKAERDKGLYKSDFLGVSKRTGKAVFNYLVKIATERAYDVFQDEYQDIVTVRKSMENIGYTVEDINNDKEKEEKENGLAPIYKSFIDDFNSVSFFTEKMRVCCNYYINYPQLFSEYEKLLYFDIPTNYTNYLNLLGPEKISSLNYQESDILNFIQSEKNRLSGRNDIIKSFEVEKRYTLKDIKEKLTNIYNSLGVSKSPKATDLNEYFELKPCKFLVEGVKENGFRIVKLK